LALPTSPFGAAWPADSAQRNLFTVATWALAIGSADTLMSAVFNAGFARRMVAQASGTLYVKRQGDTAFTPYVVSAGTVLEGIFIALGGTTTGSSGITVNLEV
jgi:hypothetical protein